MFAFLWMLIIYPITLIIEYVFVSTERIFGEIGISIAALAFTLSLLCLPLYNVAEKLQNAERQKRRSMKRAIDKIKAVFVGDERYLLLQTYYRQNHYHPIYALRSSLSFLIQIPFFIAAFTYLSESEALKGASFLFLHDLGQADGLLRLGGGGGE